MRLLTTYHRVFVGVGAYIATLTPNRRPFSVYDASISFPYVADEKIPTYLLVVVAVGGPAIIIFLVAMILVPGPTVSKSIPRNLVWRRKLWEWYAGWSGLALSVGASFFIISGMKNIFGKPRPHTLAACDPDLANFANYVVGGFAADTLNYSVLVSAEICRQTDDHILKDTFRSFPSGHASTAAGGLLYLSLFLASKLAITIPFLAPRNYSRSTRVFAAFPSRTPRHGLSSRFRPNVSADRNAENGYAKDPEVLEDPYASPSGHDDAEIAARSQSAAPPIYLLVIAFVPFGVAVYICATRFTDFYHFGFDLLSGFFIGTLTAIFSFRFYHLPISGGAGWAWGPRSAKRAFWAGIGVGTYSSIEGDDENEDAFDGPRNIRQADQRRDEEAGPSSVGRQDVGIAN